LKEVIACFPVYRTYVTADDPVREADVRHLQRAIRCVKERTPHVSSLVYDFIERLLLKQTPVSSPEERDERSAFIGKFQQITGPVAAKGIEDTALYIYNRLLSLNEVGASPMRFGLEPAAVHRWMERRQRQCPFGLSATSTHDTKRGEDVRARLDVLSEIPGAWKEALIQWRALNRRLKREVNGRAAPDQNEEYFLYQTLVGAWPFDQAAEAEFPSRIRAYMTKALREAKVHTSWVSPNEHYEAAVLHFVDAILDERRPFLRAFRPFQSRVAGLGIYNSLAQLLIKITAPGVPDFYQGSELWDLSLVDPDNRRQVDYARRRMLLDEIMRSDARHRPRTLYESREDGRLKLFVMSRALEIRRAHAPLFGGGDYVPLEAAGSRCRHLFGFARIMGSAVVVTAVPRLVATLGPEGTTPLDREAWNDTRLQLPASFDGPELYDVFTGSRVIIVRDDRGAFVRAAELFEQLPLALLTSEPPRF
jgi:(1->4)-alpha-D-glucan 1-alpha-D-glucosylmutase